MTLLNDLPAEHHLFRINSLSRDETSCILEPSQVLLNFKQALKNFRDPRIFQRISI
jgi:hypothetical protein